MRWRDYIDPITETLRGKPVFKGTHIIVEEVLEQLNEGWTETKLLETYPQLTRDHILAALAYSTQRDDTRGKRPQ